MNSLRKAYQGYPWMMAALLLAVAAVTFFVDPAASVVPLGLAAVVAVKSAPVTNMDSTPIVLNPANKMRARDLRNVGVCAVANGDSIASIFRFCRIRSSDRVAQVFLDCDAITSAAADFGLYQTAQNGGAVVDADFFASAQSIASALRATDITRESGVITVANFEKTVWELLGLSADPMIEYDVAATLTAAAAAAGSVALQVVVNGNS